MEAGPNKMALPVPVWGGVEKHFTLGHYDRVTLWRGQMEQVLRASLRWQALPGTLLEVGQASMAWLE